MRDHIDLSADEADLEAGRLGDVDDAFLAGGDEPLLGHGILLDQCETRHSRYIAFDDDNTIYLEWREKILDLDATSTSSLESFERRTP
ncbi:hypothetical protein GCM10009803_16190 [Microbacterium ginsengiterrae]